MMDFKYGRPLNFKRWLDDNAQKVDDGTYLADDPPLVFSARLADGRQVTARKASFADGSLTLQAEAEAPLAYADALGRAVAKKLADDGAKELIAALLATP